MTHSTPQSDAWAPLDRLADDAGDDPALLDGCRPLSWRYVTPRTWIDPGSAPTAAELIRTRWREDGICARVDPDAWFPESDGPAHRTVTRICAACPVRRHCLSWALWFGEEYGIWAGTTARDRQWLRRRLRAGEPLDAVVEDTLRADHPDRALGETA